MQIIDGYCNEPNIFADDIGEYNTAIWGTRDCVLPAGERLGYELVSNNEIKIKDGVFSTQGRRGVIKKGTTESCIIENGTQAENRNDLIVIEYAKDSSTLVESHTLKVIKGTPGEAATDPDVVTGDIQAGDVLHQMPLYRVKLEGLNVVAVERLFSVGNNAIGKEFDPDKDYEIGDLTLQYNKAWKFKVKHLAGAWDESQMEETDVLTELAAQNKNFAELNKKIPNPVLLWENPDPTQRFPADGIIELSSGDYEWLEIYYYSNTTTNGVLYQKVKKGDMPILIHTHFTSSGSGFGYRALQYVDDTHLKGTGYSVRQYFSNNVTPQFDNKATAYGIPVKIYGIK